MTSIVLDMSSPAVDPTHLLLGLACFSFVVLFLYFVPTLIAIGREHHDAAAIALVNLLLGWSFLGWLVALVWSFTAVERRRYRRYGYED
jgi:hypothetical protein